MSKINNLNWNCNAVTSLQRDKITKILHLEVSLQSLVLQVSVYRLLFIYAYNKSVIL